MTQPEISGAFTGANNITFGETWSRDITLTQGGPPLNLAAYDSRMRAQMRIASAAGSTATLIASTEVADYALAAVAQITVILPTGGADGVIRISQTVGECRRMSAVVGNVGKTFYIEFEGVTSGGAVAKLGQGQMEFLPETTVTEPDPI